MNINLKILPMITSLISIFIWKHLLELSNLTKSIKNVSGSKANKSREIWVHDLAEENDLDFTFSIHRDVFVVLWLSARKISWTYSNYERVCCIHFLRYWIFERDDSFHLLFRFWQNSSSLFPLCIFSSFSSFYLKTFLVRHFHKFIVDILSKDIVSGET